MATATMTSSPFMSLWDLLRQEEEKTPTFRWEDYEPKQNYAGSPALYRTTTPSKPVNLAQYFPPSEALKSVGIGFLATTMLSSIGFGTAAGFVYGLEKSFQSNWKNDGNLISNLTSTFMRTIKAVSYTHLTLPTILLV